MIYNISFSFLPENSASPSERRVGQCCRGACCKPLCLKNSSAVESAVSVSVHCVFMLPCVIFVQNELSKLVIDFFPKLSNYSILNLRSM